MRKDKKCHILSYGVIIIWQHMTKYDTSYTFPEIIFRKFIKIFLFFKDKYPQSNKFFFFFEKIVVEQRKKIVLMQY